MFADSKLEGHLGEHTIWNLFVNQPWVRSVVDVREDKGFQEQDIDFLVEDHKRQYTSFEVKTDFRAHETGNIVYEYTTNGNMGCFEKTKAKFVVYYVPGSKEAHVIDVSALRDYIYRVRPDEVNMGDKSTGFLIPIKDLQDAEIIKKTYKGVM